MKNDRFGRFLSLRWGICTNKPSGHRLQTIVMVIRTRHLWNKTTREVIFYLSSLPPDAQRLGKAIRQHWSIENQLHWILDVTLRCDPAEVSSAKERAPREGEDACRIRTGNAPENIA